MSQLKQTIEVISSAFDIEITKLHLRPEAQMLIADSFTNWYYQEDLYSFFILGNLHAQTDYIMRTPTLRDFVLNVTDRVSIQLVMFDIDREVLLKEVVLAVCSTKVNPVEANNSLLIKEINEGLYVNPGALTSLLKENFWILVLFLLTVFFQQTLYYQQLNEL
jgi:hypothetical protein